MSEHEESAPPCENSRRSRAGSVINQEYAEEDSPVVQSELLTYVVHYYQRNSAEKIKNTVLAFYTAEEIVTAKTVIWHAYENCLPPERRRVTTDKRSANEANLTDIIGAVSDLDAKGKVLSGRFCAMKLDRLPKYAPEETNVMAMMDRMRVVELQLNEVQDLSTRNRECIVNNARHICEVGSRNSGADKPSYSAVVSNSPVSQRMKKAVAVGGGTAGNGYTSVKKVIGGGTAVYGYTGVKNAVGGGTAVYGYTGVKNAVGGGSGIADNEQSVNTGVRNAVGGGSGIADNEQSVNTGVRNAVGGGSGIADNEQSVNTGVRNAVGGGSGIAGNAQNDNTGVKNAGAVAVDKADTVQNVYKGRPLGRRDIVSVNTTDTDNGFLYQPREVRRMRKQQSHSAVVGTREANGRFRGAQAPSRDIFVYRVENDALESEIECHFKDNGIVPRSVETVSHADAMYKSFKLTVSVNDMGKVLDADFWPEGIMVRRYRTTQSPKWREALTN